MTHESGAFWIENVLSYRGLDPGMQTIEDGAEWLPGAFQLQLLVWAEWGFFEVSLLTHPKLQFPALDESCWGSNEALRRAGEFYYQLRVWGDKKFLSPPSEIRWTPVQVLREGSGTPSRAGGTVGLWNTLVVRKLPLQENQRNGDVMWWNDLL